MENFNEFNDDAEAARCDDDSGDRAAEDGKGIFYATHICRNHQFIT